MQGSTATSCNGAEAKQHMAITKVSTLGFCVIAFEEELDLPAILVDGRDCGGTEFEVLGQRREDFPGLLGDHLEPTQIEGALSVPVRTGEPDHLVGNHHVVLGPAEKEDTIRGRSGEPGEVQVGAIHHHDRAGLKAQLASDANVRALPLGDQRNAGQVPVLHCLAATEQFVGDPRVALRARLLYGLLDLQTRKELEKLASNAAEPIHGCGPPSSVRWNLRKSHPNRSRRPHAIPNPNLAKSNTEWNP